MKPQTKELIFEGVGLIVLLSAFFYLGYYYCEYSNYNNTQKEVDGLKVDGLNIRNANETQAFEITKEKDKRGDWICVNVDDMTYDRMVEVCRHEAGHEIWAEICEKDDEMCQKGQELLNNYSKI